MANGETERLERLWIQRGQFSGLSKPAFMAGYGEFLKKPWREQPQSMQYMYGWASEMPGAFGQTGIPSGAWARTRGGYGTKYSTEPYPMSGDLASLVQRARDYGINVDDLLAARSQQVINRPSDDYIGAAIQYRMMAQVPSIEKRRAQEATYKATTTPTYAPKLGTSYQAAYLASLPKFEAPAMTEYYGTRATPIYQQYLAETYGGVGIPPAETTVPQFKEYLKTYPFEERYRARTPRQKGVYTGQFVPPTRFLNY